MDTDQGGPGPEGHEGAMDAVIKRACDQCRTRKIRCDKESPCSNCRIAQRTCSSTGVGQKPKESRQRVLISTQYERKIDHIEDRLGSIEKLLRKLVSEPQRDVTSDWFSRPSSLRQEPSGTSTAFSATPSSSSVDTPSATNLAIREARQDNVSPFEGNSSMTAQTAFASEFIEHAVGATPLADLSPDMARALTSLRQIATMHNTGPITAELRFPRQKPVPNGGLRDMPMPPMNLVVEMLRHAKATSPATFTLMLCFIALDDFTEHCRRVYFAAEDYPPALFIIVNVGVYYMLQEKIGMAEQDDRRQEYQQYSDCCRQNLETAIGSLPLLCPETKENVEALLVGASWAVEISKPSLAWQLTAKATQLCHSLGYHRSETFRDVTPEAKSKDNRPILFWLAYILDKGLALRLGRPPTIADYDITSPREIKHRDVPPEWQEILGMWIQHAEVQGNIYEKLYSPTALSAPAEERLAEAQLLAARLKLMSTQAHLMRTKFPARKGLNFDFNSSMLDMLVKSDEVSFLSSLTMVYRAMPLPPGSGSMFIPDCIETAREAIQKHLYCMKILETSQYLTEAYLHWTILYAPFTPFIVLFCHVIETSNDEDMNRLTDFVTSLEGSCEASEAVAKLHRICQILSNIAKLYLESMAKSQEDQTMYPIGNEVNMHLSQLGFMPTLDSMGNIAMGDLQPTVTTSQTAQLGDWYSGNRYMMNLMEEDLTQFGPVTWAGPG